MRGLTLAVVAWAQLLWQPGDHTSVEEAERELFLHAMNDAPQDGTLSSPTICDSKVKQHSGYLNAADGNQYFFWMFESRSDPAKDPVVLWLTGGPGCSSIMALFAENGPCKVNKDATGTENNPYSWNTKANVIYVDQPAQTGFSKGSHLAHGEDDVAKNMVPFLQNFYKALPQYKANPFYIFGESYGGHYVPAIAHAVWADKTSAFKIPLTGIGIGNGLVDPAEQYKWYAQMAKDGGKGEGGTLEKGVITNPIAQAIMKAAIGPCTSAIDKCNSGTSASCESAYMICNYGEQMPYQMTGMNPYDMRIKCAQPPLCYDFSAVDKYLNTADVQKEIGVSGTTWKECNMAVNMLFQMDFMKNFHLMLPDLLENGIKVLIYAGDVDYICNWLGNKHWTLVLPWKGQKDFAAAKDDDWQVGGKSAGRKRTAGGFSFLQVYQAGHMVPMDKPAEALQMLNEHIHPSEVEEMLI